MIYQVIANNNLGSKNIRSQILKIPGHNVAIFGSISSTYSLSEDQ